MAITQIGLFRIEGTLTLTDRVRDALDRCTYPLERMEPRMRALGFNYIRVLFVDGTDPILQGRYWGFARTSLGLLYVRSDIPVTATKILFTHETAHFVDSWVFTDNKRRRIHRYYHDMDPNGTANPNHGWFDADPAGVARGFSEYRSEQQEGFAADFPDTFSDLGSPSAYEVEYSHRLAASRYDGIRSLVLGTSTESPEPPEPPPDPVEPEPPPIPEPEPTPPETPGGIDTGFDLEPFDPCG